jgi:hypothetical protein
LFSVHVVDAFDEEKCTLACARPSFEATIGNRARGHCARERMFTMTLPPVARAIVLREHGPASSLGIDDHDPGLPGAGEVLVRHTAIGVNFHDTYVRSGQYQTLPLPGIPGIEAAGVVLELGEGVTGLKIGDRITYVNSAYGAYATHRRLAASLAIPLPDDIADDVAASMMVRGMTIEMLVGRVHNLRADETILGAGCGWRRWPTPGALCRKTGRKGDRDCRKRGKGQNS